MQSITLRMQWIICKSLLIRKENAMALTEAQKRAKEKYRKKTTQILVEFYPQDAELLQRVNEQPNKQAYIKELIKKDIR